LKSWKAPSENKKARAVPRFREQEEQELGGRARTATPLERWRKFAVS
jgi:hypothetical protein